MHDRDARAAAARAGVTVAEVNLKFIWDVVSQHQDRQGGPRLRGRRAAAISSRTRTSAWCCRRPTSPGSSRCARRSTVRRPRQPARRPGDERVTDRRRPAGPRRCSRPTPRSRRSAGWCSSSSRWSRRSRRSTPIIRTALLLVAGLALSVAREPVCSRAAWCSRSSALQAGAARIGAGDLDHRIEVSTGDELEALADQFNRMAAQLQESYAGLERRSRSAPAS